MKYVCFRCRKMFNTHGERSGTGRPPENFARHACPQCGEVMTYPGRYFKPPKQNEVEAWQVAETLIKQGYLFDGTYGHGSVANRPRTMRQLKEFLDKQKANSANPK